MEEFTLSDADVLSEEIKFLSPRYQAMVIALAAAAFRPNGAGAGEDESERGVAAEPRDDAPAAGGDAHPTELLLQIENRGGHPSIGEVLRRGYVAGPRQDVTEDGKPGRTWSVAKVGQGFSVRFD